MAGVALVRVDSTVGTVSPPPGLGSLLNDNVLDDQLLDIKVLSLSVGLGVLEETEDELDRLLGPSTLGSLELLGLRSSANTASEPSERNNLLVVLNVGEVSVRLLQVHARKGSGHLSHVLEVSSEVLASGLGELLGVARGDVGRGVNVLPLPEHQTGF